MNSAPVAEVEPKSGLEKERVLEALAAQDYSPAVLRRALLLEQEEQERLFSLARARRGQFFPDNAAEVRSVVELSNVCTQQCEYCGMGRPGSPKYLISRQEFVERAGVLCAAGRRVLLLQAGENRSPAFVEHVCACLREVRRRSPELQFIVCIGNLHPEQYRQLRQAGADRYILKFETSNPQLYARVKPRDTLAERLACLEDLLALGFKVGSGNIVGLPGQSLDDLVADLLFAGRYPLAMVSCSVFIPGEGSRLRDQRPGRADWALNTIALMRIMYPNRLIPTTSPLERVTKDGQFLGLMAGANTVTIHDGTPKEFRALFPIYSGRRFAPNAQHIHDIVQRAGLRLAPGPLI